MAIVSAVLMTAGPTDAMASASPQAPSTVRAWLGDLKLVDYFPADDAWDNMWTKFNPTTVGADFARIAAMHANAVRIIPRVPAFGYPEPSAAMLSELHQTIALAQANGLRVELTMFDGFNSYADVAGSEEWVSALLRPYAGDREIAYVDLENEIDRQPSQALSWAQQLIPYVRGLGAGIPVTASVTINDGPQNLRNVLAGLGNVRPDFYDVHFYGQDGQAYPDLRAAQQLVAPAPVVLGETGYSTTTTNSTVPGLPRTAASQDAYQAYYLRSVDYAAATLGIPAAPWILSDFTPDAWPGASAQQFGLYRANGRPKPAVSVESSYFSADSVSIAFNGNFEQTTVVDGRLEPLLWREYQPSDVTATFAADQSVAHSGTTSAEITGTSGGTWGCGAFYLVPISTLNPDQTYTADVYARGQTATGSTYLSLSWMDANGTYLSQTTSANLPPGTTGWHLLTASGKPPAQAVFVQLYLKSCRNSGSAWFDDATFNPVPQLGGTTTGSGSPSGGNSGGSSGSSSGGSSGSGPSDSTPAQPAPSTSATSKTSSGVRAGTTSAGHSRARKPSAARRKHKSRTRKPRAQQRKDKSVSDRRRASRRHPAKRRRR
ncbi:MAG TPA: carbohydrate binding domain-containing protein [Solirubrobacteraceae bacterium]|nr:carbohydrate binding domain-containing protein [Solirubrobacteraceae bacterium]